MFGSNVLNTFRFMKAVNFLCNSVTITFFKENIICYMELSHTQMCPEISDTTDTESDVIIFSACAL
jgi:hypothetical protein